MLKTHPLVSLCLCLSPISECYNIIKAKLYKRNANSAVSVITETETKLFCISPCQLPSVTVETIDCLL